MRNLAGTSLSNVMGGKQMRSLKFLKKAPRSKNKRGKISFRDYKKLAAEERERATARLFGTLGPASPVRNPP